MQSLKAQLPIDLTDEGINISVKDEHLLKQSLPIETTDEGIDTLFNEVHRLKAFSPIDLIDGGIAIFVKFSQPKKHSSQM